MSNANTTIDASLSLDQVSSDETVMMEIKCGGQVFSVNKEYVKISNMIQNAISCDVDSTSISIDACHEEMMPWVIRYFNDCKGQAQNIIHIPLRSKSLKFEDHDASKIDATFIADFMESHENHMQPVYKLISVANYLDIQSLLYIACARVALQIKDVPVDKIKEKLRE
jgi:hypothetical protein